MINIQDKTEVRQLIIEACTELNYKNRILNAPEAIELLIGTWSVESDGGHWLKQIGSGIALGAWQIEKPTFCDIINRCKPVHSLVLSQTINHTINDGDFHLLEFDHKLSIQIARLKYYLIPDAIPLNLDGQARMWKQFYNSPKGAGTVEKYIAKYKTYA